MVTMMLATTMASKEGEELEVLADEADLQVDAMVEAGEVVVAIMVKEVVVVQIQRSVEIQAAQCRSEVHC